MSADVAAVDPLVVLESDQFVELIVRWRNALGLNQTDLGKMIGLNQTQVSMVENKTMHLNPFIRHQIVKGLLLTPEQFLAGRTELVTGQVRTAWRREATRILRGR